MVTANNACKRFKKKSTMNNSNAEKYMRAKRRNEVTPQCLFGTPSETETDQFLSQQDLKEKGENQQTLEKYDLTDIPKEFFENITNIEDKETASTSGQSTSTSSEGQKFQPRIITDDDPPPTENLFSPIDKLQSTSSESSQQPKHTELEQFVLLSFIRLKTIDICVG
ncbi:hypothetical protein PGB90_008530 [Kerria lacca]